MFQEASQQGKSENDGLYGWDNEYGNYSSDVAEFNASKYLVSNREFFEFIEDDGYQTESYWTPEGWSWVQYKNAKHPLFWIRSEDGSYRFRTMLKEIDMPWAWPAETNYLEAKAFCNWKSSKTGEPVRLPTEEEWYRLLDYTETPDALDWEKTPGNLNLEDAASSVPVDRYPFGHGFYDILGNVAAHGDAYPRSTWIRGASALRHSPADFRHQA